MASGLLALLDDVAAVAKLALASVDDVAAGVGKATVKAAGVVIDDAAVTPGYVAGFTPDRELPVVARIAAGSLRNKLLFILPAALLLSALAPWLLVPILLVGGAYLAFEGTEKLAEALGLVHHHEPAERGPRTPAQEEALVAGAIRTDFILSAEILVLALGEVAGQPLPLQAVVLLGVSLLVTAAVYGAVALIVKLDDVGLTLHRQGRPAGVRALGRGLVVGAPLLLASLSRLGTAALLWVGGGIFLHELAVLGLGAPEHLVQEASAAVGALAGGLAGWLVQAGGGAAAGLVVGALVLAAVEGVRRLRGR